MLEVGNKEAMDNHEAWLIGGTHRHKDEKPWMGTFKDIFGSSTLNLMDKA